MGIRILQINKWFYIFLLLLFFSCRRECEQIWPHILYKTAECKDPIRVDYLGSMMIFYLNDSYDVDNFAIAYSEILLLIEDQQWNFDKIDYDFLSKHANEYNNEEFIEMIQNLNFSVLGYNTKLIGRHNRGFALKVTNPR